MSDKISLLKEVNETIKKTHEQNPIAPSITNMVTINFVANAQLAAGGRAFMVTQADEGRLIASISKSAYINLGTMMDWYDSTITEACKAFVENKNNWVFDPVGLGIGTLRTGLFKMMKDCKPAVIRGNASEIIGLASMWGVYEGAKNSLSGVDSADSVAAAKTPAEMLAKFTGGAVAVSGKEDLVTDGTTTVLCHGGSPMLSKITGAGCSLGGVICVYANVATPFAAALTGTVVYNEAAKKAEAKSRGPASFMQNFIDEIYCIDESTILNSEIELVEG